jgi:ParB-like chromosome segregation protein Spo0J
VADIKEHGLIEPITTSKGTILDGLTRFRACGEAGVEPRFVEFEGDSPLDFVIAKNLQRRNMTALQKAAVALLLLPQLSEQAKARQREHGGSAPGKSKTVDPEVGASVVEAGRAVEIAAKRVGVGKDAVWSLKRIKDTDADLFEEVREGKIKTVANAEEELFKRHPQEKPKPKDKGKGKGKSKGKAEGKSETKPTETETPQEPQPGKGPVARPPADASPDGAKTEAETVTTFDVGLFVVASGSAFTQPKYTLRKLTGDQIDHILNCIEAITPLRATIAE